MYHLCQGDSLSSSSADSQLLAERRQMTPCTLHDKAAAWLGIRRSLLLHRNNRRSEKRRCLEALSRHPCFSSLFSLQIEPKHVHPTGCSHLASSNIALCYERGRPASVANFKHRKVIPGWSILGRGQERKEGRGEETGRQLQRGGAGHLLGSNFGDIKPGKAEWIVPSCRSTGMSL